MELAAFGPRTVTASLAFDTSAGWYTVAVPAMELSNKTRQLRAPGDVITFEDATSHIAFVRFPQPVRIKGGWVSSAIATGDGIFGWQAKGLVSCDPIPNAPPSKSPQISQVVPLYEWMLDPRDADRLTNQPRAGALILPVVSSKALELPDCAEPFRDAAPSKQVSSDFPFIARGQVQGQATSAVEVAVNGDGNVRDAWILGPSGFDALDQATLEAAKKSTYVGARAYCRPVPSIYLFFTTFVP